MANNWEFPKKIDHFMRLLVLKYQKENKNLLRRIFVNASYTVVECTEYDNWNGGTAGHDIKLAIPEQLYLEVMDEKSKLETELVGGLNGVNYIENEYVRKLIIEPSEILDVDWRQAHNDVRLKKFSKIVPDASMKRIWKQGCVRLFLSHKVEYKKIAEELKELLLGYGISTFVAHTSIYPSKEWLDEIENALLTMNAFVALLTKDFQNSEWTDQEVGFAISRKVPIIPISISGCDPHGFMARYQKMNATLDNPSTMAADIYSILAQEPSLENLKGSVVNAFVRVTSYMDAGEFLKNKLPAVRSLNSEQIEIIKKGYARNSQLNSCVIVRKHLPNVLYDLTGKKFSIENGQLVGGE